MCSTTLSKAGRKPPNGPHVPFPLGPSISLRLAPTAPAFTSPPSRCPGHVVAASYGGGFGGYGPAVQPRSVLAAVSRVARFDPVLGVGLLGMAIFFPDGGITAGEAATRPADTLSWLLLFGQTLPLAWRRSRPPLALALVSAAFVADDALRYPPSPANLGLLVALFSAGAHTPAKHRSRAAGVGVVAALAELAALDLVGALPVEGIFGSVTFMAVFAGFWGVGAAWRTRQLRVAALEARAALLESQQMRLRQEAAAQERARLSRDMHDLISHHVTLMVVQADGARLTFDDEPARGKESLQRIGEVGRRTLGELRQLLGVLRDEAASVTTPVLGVGDLPALVSGVQDVGLDVDVTEIGAVRALEPQADATVYRIVQEALTNLLRHAAASQARLLLRYGDDAVTVEIVGPQTHTERPPSRGYGLSGMRERVELLGGRLEVSYGPGEPSLVRATLPYGRPA